MTIKEGAMGEVAGTVEIEVTTLEGLDLEGAPPCDMYVSWRLFGLAKMFGRGRKKRCGRPSTHRVKVTCPVHGPRFRFLCTPHLRVVKLGAARCMLCDSRTKFDALA